MILNFTCKESEKYFKENFLKSFPPQIQRTARRKLLYLDEAEEIRDLRSPPGNRLESLKDNHSRQWSIRINNQWRICFSWQGQHAFDVEITDYN